MLTAAWLFVGTLNFELCPRPEQATAYVGLAPLPRMSGTSVRGRAQIGHGGNARVHTALYLATLTATRYNPPVKTFYERLRAAGKLLHQPWAVVSKG